MAKNQKESFPLQSYIQLIGTTFISFVAYLVLNMLFDFEAHFYNLYFFVVTAWAGVTTFLTKKQVNTFESKNVRNALYGLTFGMILIGCFLIGICTRGLTSETRYISNLQEAVQTDGTYYNLQECPQIDTSHIGIHTVPEITHSRAGSRLAFETYVVHPFAGARGLYYGYKVTSKPINLSFASKDKIMAFERESKEKRYELIKAHEIDADTRLYKKIKENDPLYSNFIKAHEQCNDVENYTLQTYTIFTPIDKSARTGRKYSIIFFLVIYFIVYIPLFALFFKRTYNNEKVYDQLKKEEQKEKNDIIAFVKDKSHWYAIAIGAAMIAYYIVALILGYDEHIPQIYSYGAVSYYSLFIEGEWWRLLTSIFMHASIYHLLGNFTAYWLIVSFMPKTYHSWRLLVLFLLSGILSGLAHTLISTGGNLVGASGAIMGMCGALIGEDILRKITQKKKVKTSTAHSSSITILAVTILLPTFIGSFQNRVSMTAHVVGFISGMIIGLIFACIAKNQTTKNQELKNSITQ